MEEKQLEYSEGAGEQSGRDAKPVGFRQGLDTGQSRRDVLQKCRLFRTAKVRMRQIQGEIEQITVWQKEQEKLNFLQVKDLENAGTLN